MALSTQERQIIEFGKTNGKTKEQSIAALAKFRQSQTAEPKKQGFLADMAGDLKQGFLGVGEQLYSAGEDISDLTMKRELNKNLSAPELLTQVGGRAFGGASSAFGEGVKGLVKAVLPQREEDKVKAAIQSGTETVMSTEVAQNLLSRYQSLSPAAKAQVDAGLGFASGLADIGTGGVATRVAREGVDLAITGAQSVSSQIARRTAQQAAEEALEEAVTTGTKTGILQSTRDVVGGLGTQVKNFAKRTGREARETAQQARQLATLPEPEANLLRAGTDERLVTLVKNSSPEERGVYKELVESAKRKEADLEAPQPKVIAGREFMKPVNYLLQRRDEVGSQLGDLRKGLSTEKTINTNPYFREFHEYLRDDLGLNISNGKIKPGTGRIAQSDIREIQKLYDELRSKTFASEKEIDEFLQRTFKEYDLRQAREKTFSDDVTRVAERARSVFRQAMPENYNSLSKEYARILKPIQDVVKLLGYKGSVENLTAKELRAAEVALRVLGNAADRPQSVIDDLLEVAAEQGYKSDINLNRVILLSDQLEDLYDITPTRGFSGSTTRGVNQSGAGVLGDIATLDIKSLFGKALDSKASQKEIQEAFEVFLNSL